MTRNRILIGMLVSAFVISLAFYAFWGRGDSTTPPEEGEAQGEAPAIPEEISTGENKEPRLKVYIAEEDRVEEMNMEEYVMGVVAAEMDPDWPRRALEAQAIIARSFTLQKIAETGGVKGRNAHASTDIEEFQAYDAGRINDNVRQAVAATRGQVAVYGSEFIRGWFHAYAGPKTATAKEGLDYKDEEPPYIQVVESPARSIIPEEEKNWQATFPGDKIRNAVRSIAGKDPGTVTSMEIAKKGPSGRVTLFKVNDTEVSGPALRIALGSTEMRSTYVTDLSVENGQVSLQGEGYGHGVGMCQWGARAMADDEKSVEEIVRYYYKDIQIVKMWE